MARSLTTRNTGLDTPRESRRSLRPNYDPEVFGRLSERFARFLGTAQFLVYMTAFVLSWVLWNSLAPRALRFDDFPFIFLTLILSLQASYAAPLILLAQNRQAKLCQPRIQYGPNPTCPNACHCRAATCCHKLRQRSRQT